MNLFRKLGYLLNSLVPESFAAPSYPESKLLHALNSLLPTFFAFLPYFFFLYLTLRDTSMASIHFSGKTETLLKVSLLEEALSGGNRNFPVKQSIMLFLHFWLACTV